MSRNTETDLVKTTYLDSLAVLQQTKDLENAERLGAQERARQKKIDKNVVYFYIHEKFPDAVRELSIKNLSEKELPSILKRAKRYFRLKIAAAGAILSLISGGTIASLTAISSLGFWLVPILIIAIMSYFLGFLFIYEEARILTKGVYWESIPGNNDNDNDNEAPTP